LGFGVLNEPFVDCDGAVVRIFKGVSSCKGWDQNPNNVQRTVDILTDIAQAIVKEGVQDIGLGFGVLNEPFVDRDGAVVRIFKGVSSCKGWDQNPNNVQQCLPRVYYNCELSWVTSNK
jgi:hypothetical protein